MLRFSALRTVLARSQSRALQTTSFILPDPATKNGQLTKIVATIGPTSEQAEPLKLVTQAGMKIMRLNFSHATKEEVELRTTNLAAAQPFVKELRAVLLDTKGPEIRSGKLANDTSGHDTIHLEEGKSISLTNDPAEKENGTEQQLYIDYAGLQRCLSPGMKVLLDDGAITLTVTSVGEKIECTIDNTGDLRSRAGVNLPLADTSDLPAMSDKDKADILYGMSMDIDYVAASFVQTAQGVREIRAHIADCAKKLGWSADQPLPLIISKIETAGALQHFDEILKESDGIMVARGDLGVEIPLTQVTNAQKEMVAACNAVGKPVRAMGHSEALEIRREPLTPHVQVIVATQMLETMAKNPRPTRAEVSDVTNAVYDGADAVMLSGETAKGKFPTKAVQTMNEIISAAETYASSGALGNPTKHVFHGPKTASAAIAKAAAAAVEQRGCSAIVVTSAAIAPLVAAYRPHVPIYVLCDSPKEARQLQIYRGIYPIVDADKSNAVEATKGLGYLEAGSEVVVVECDAATPVMKLSTV